MYSRLIKSAESLKKIIDFVPEVAIVLGSGLGDFAEKIDVKFVFDFKDIEGFPTSTVDGHNGKLYFGFVNETPVVIMQGRVHCYEGYSSSEVVFPIRVLGLLGVKKIILTNAAGGINKDFEVGDFMLLTDHISFVPSPLIGKNFDELGPRFPDMSEVYDNELRTIAKKCAQKCGVKLKEGVYCQLTGPNYETPAEVKMCKILGADAVGMSTAVEAVAARHMGIKVCGISVITNMAAGISQTALSHEEVKETADLSKDKFQKLLFETIKNLRD